MGLRTIEPETQSLFSDEIIEENENQSPGTNVFEVGRKSLIRVRLRVLDEEMVSFHKNHT